jgi:hypothetical protein
MAGYKRDGAEWSSTIIVTIARPDIVAGLPARKPNLPYVLQTASGETIPVMREAHVELTLGRPP